MTAQLQDFRLGTFLQGELSYGYSLKPVTVTASTTSLQDFRITYSYRNPIGQIFTWT